MLYKIQNATVSLGGEVILDHIDFHIKGKEKAALVGRNGAGKTTLFKLLAGELDPDFDDTQQQKTVERFGSFTVGILHQNPVTEPEKLLREWITERAVRNHTDKDRYEFESEFYRILHGMGFQQADADKKLGDFSGGEKTRIILVGLLVEKPDVLLLDEPTNHLDMETTEWLEEELCHYPGAVLLTSHDRFFLDRVVDVVWELQDRKLQRYAGGYTDYRKAKQETFIRNQKKYEEQQAEIKRLNELIERFRHKPNKASFARSRKKVLERMELIDKPKNDDVSIFTGEMIPVNRGAKWVLETEELKIGYEKELFSLSFRLRRGQKIGLLGSNGAGKSAILKTITGKIDPISGTYRIGNHIDIGYFDQQTTDCFAENPEESQYTVWEWFCKRFPGMLKQDVREILAQYLFNGKLLATPVSKLSGGEKARLVLCQILTERPNFLILDEPTNHMDIPARETLESALRVYQGTILFVSHDRYFLNEIADSLLVLESGKPYFYPFGYTHYLDRKRRFADEGDASVLASLVQAENAALLEDFQSVPKKERHESRQMTSDEAHRDWQLRLAKDPMNEAEEKVKKLTDLRDRAKTIEDYERFQAELDQATEEWTRLCNDWYDIYRE